MDKLRGGVSRTAGAVRCYDWRDNPAYRAVLGLIKGLLSVAAAEYLGDAATRGCPVGVRGASCKRCLASVRASVL